MRIRCGSAAVLGLFLMFLHTTRGADSDLSITCEKKRIESHREPHPAGEFGTSKKTEKWGFSVSLENQGFNALSNLEVKYVIFYKHEDLGVKGPPQKKTKTGSHTVDNIDSMGQTTFDTVPVVLSKDSLEGGAYFGNGAKSAVADTISGIWIRVYQNGALFTEYAYPSGLTSTETWQE